MAKFWTWNSVKEYLDTSMLTKFLVPRGNLRRWLLRRESDAGVLGMSLGLTYTPGVCASEDELIRCL